jgi:hypothetical protein
MESRSFDITFIRHAESEENVKVSYLCSFVSKLMSFRLPNLTEVVQSLKVLKIDEDSDVSQLGKRQLMDMKLILKSKKFWSQEFDFIVHSPLKRAVVSCMDLVPDEKHGECTCLDVLREITPLEQIIKYQLQKKVKGFELWLSKQDVAVKRILVVGHCQYFNNLLGMKTFMRNCDVWASTVILTTQSSGSEIDVVCSWEKPRLLHRTELSVPHPIGNLLQQGGSMWGWLLGIPEVTGEGGEEGAAAVAGGMEAAHTVDAAGASHSHSHCQVDDDLDDDVDEPTCRICQVFYPTRDKLYLLRLRQRTAF